MKKLLYFIFLIMLPYISFGQVLLDSLNVSTHRTDNAHHAIKDFRNMVNAYADNPLKTNSSSFGEWYIELYEALDSVVILALDSSVFSESSIEQLTLNWASHRDSFFTSIRILDSARYIYEDRIFEVHFMTLDTSLEPNPAINILVSNYNTQLQSVGRRMGRLIQSACIEDDDYVTQQSYTRLDMALSDLKIAELYLRNALHEESIKTIPVTDKDTIHYEQVKTLPANSWFMFASSDLKDNLGAGVLWHLRKVDLSFDAFFVFQTESGVQFHPKIGIPVNNFHFLAGLLSEVSAANQFTYEYTGNIYYTNNNFIGGLGFSRNRILFSVGWRIM